jgi:hypothetical protein
MQSLRDLQRQFARALVASAPTDGMAFDVASMDVYRSNGRATYHRALAATYPVVKRLTGTPFFNAAVDAFVAAHPPVCSDLNVYGERFAGFVERYAPAVQLPYLADVARLEWAIDVAYRVADAPRVPDAVLAALSIVPPERMPQVHIALDVSCRLVASAYPILHIWRANQHDRSGAERIDLDEGGALLLVRRDADGVALEPLERGDHAWLAALATGATLAGAIDAALAVDTTFELGAALRAHIGTGTIAAVLDR